MTPIDNIDDILAALLHLLATGDGDHLRLYLVMLSIAGSGGVQALARWLLGMWQ